MTNDTIFASAAGKHGFTVFDDVGSALDRRVQGMVSRGLLERRERTVRIENAWTHEGYPPVLVRVPAYDATIVTYHLTDLGRAQWFAREAV